MQVVWEADTAAFASRKRAAKACHQCQKRKKRCHHTFSRPPDQQAESDGVDKVLPNLTHKEPIHFVGDLNPESILSDLESRSKGGACRVSRVGTWVQQSRERRSEIIDPPPPGRGDKVPNNIEKYGKFDGGRRTLTGHQRSYLQSVGAFRILPKKTQEVLINTYLTSIDTLLAIIDGPKVLREFESGALSIFLTQAICLVACKAEECKQYLRLYEDGPVLEPIPFARSLHIGLDAAMKADLEPDRLTKIQILTLMHLHNDGPGGIEESSQHLSQAIHDAWSIGLHIHTPGRRLNDTASMLWWTLWTLDRINACIGGRPMMIAVRDIDISRPPLEPDVRSQIMGTWLALGDLLDQVIEFYRPTANQDCPGWEHRFPSFNTITKSINTEVMTDSQRNLLELCYNVITILSCRTGGSDTQSYARRSVASDRIQALMSSKYSKNIPRLPVVPYAVSLSLTVAYRALRDGYKMEYRAQADLSTRSEILESLSHFWWTADAMAKLGRKALKSIAQPGLKKHSVVGLANAMDAEVTPCKFGPFENRRQQDSLNLQNLRGQSEQTLKGGGLDLLSDAAATYGSSSDGISTKQQQNSRTSLNLTSKANGMNSNAHMPTSIAPESLNISSSATASNNLASTPSSNMPALTPDSSTAVSVSSSAKLNHSNTGRHFMSSSQNHPHNHAHNPSNASSSSATAHLDSNADANMDVGYPNQFDNLDDLFSGFFDLSMPTLFQDPLFEGAAFFDNGFDDPSLFGDVSMPQMGMDMGMGMNGYGVASGVGVGGVSNGTAGAPTTTTSGTNTALVAPTNNRLNSFGIDIGATRPVGVGITDDSLNTHGAFSTNGGMLSDHKSDNLGNRNRHGHGQTTVYPDL